MSRKTVVGADHYWIGTVHPSDGNPRGLPFAERVRAEQMAEPRRFEAGEALPAAVFRRIDDWFALRTTESDTHPSAEAVVQGWPFRCFLSHIIVDHSARPVHTYLIDGAICHTDSEPSWVSPHMIRVPGPEIILAYRPRWEALAADIAFYSIAWIGALRVIGAVRNRRRALRARTATAGT